LAKDKAMKPLCSPIKKLSSLDHREKAEKDEAHSGLIFLANYKHTLCVQ